MRPWRQGERERGGAASGLELGSEPGERRSQRAFVDGAGGAEGEARNPVFLGEAVCNAVLPIEGETQHAVLFRDIDAHRGRRRRRLGLGLGWRLGLGLDRCRFRLGLVRHDGREVDDDGLRFDGEGAHRDRPLEMRDERLAIVCKGHRPDILRQPMLKDRGRPLERTREVHSERFVRELRLVAHGFGPIEGEAAEPVMRSGADRDLVGGGDTRPERERPGRQHHQEMTTPHHPLPSFNSGWRAAAWPAHRARRRSEPARRAGPWHSWRRRAQASPPWPWPGRLRRGWAPPSAREYARAW